MTSHTLDRTHASRPAPEQELASRIDRVAAELEEARTQMHCAQTAVHAAEEVLLARRLECEAAMAQLADLADLLECLQQPPSKAILRRTT